MPHRPVAPSVATVVVPFDTAAPPPDLTRIAPNAVLERWAAVDRTAHTPRVVAVRDDDSTAWAGAALVTARPGAAYLKIVDAVGDVPSAVDAVVAHARERGLAQVKWEGWSVTAAQAGAAGFTPLEGPHGAPDADGPRTGYVRWSDDVRVQEPPYYRQSTTFTCGAAVALMAQVRSGVETRASLDRPGELALWREATNFPACEPVRLATAVRRAWPGSSVVVRLDVDRPIMLDAYSEDERAWRAVLQRTSRTDAAQAGVSIDGHRLDLSGLRDALVEGGQILLLVSLKTMQEFDVPHWVLCHGVVPGAVVLQDPWTNAATGDTWVDAHLLPVSDAALDAMSTMEWDGYRGAVHLLGPAVP
ncbi:peptidase C39 family protein [Nocardiopsis sp. MG754419]|uniref:peptidase C39 family protein n=1 Tax=Nocardiopsis sp. MG754419 TaxID=2259865 RepID=UPI001BA8AC02|nr:peptidase C39 family protein [Nocardiopsis sp. MG754419]MBR8740769.1 acetyltransferase [Nocardiopsis sp. MG754419]